LGIGLPEVMRSAVKQATRGGLVKSIPPTVEQLHAEQRGLPVSSRRALAKKLKWLQTEAGQAWQRERGKLMKADDQDEESSHEAEAAAENGGSGSGMHAKATPSHADAAPPPKRKRRTK
jgi:hypothetical protein